MKKLILALFLTLLLPSTILATSVDRNGLFFVPDAASTTGTASYTILDAAGERTASIFQVKKAGNIESVYLRTNTVTTGKNLKISLRGVNAAGVPDNTILGAGNAGYATAVVADANDDVWLGPFALGAVVPVTQGQFISIVIEWSDNGDPGNLRINTQVPPLSIYNSYNVSDIDASQTSGTLTIGKTYRIYTYVAGDDFMNVGAASNATNVEFIATGDTPTTWTNSSVLRSWAKTGYGYAVNVALAYNDDTFGVGNYGGAYGASQTVATGSTPDEIGNYVKFSFPFRAVGIWVYGTFTYDVTLSLLAADDTVLANCTLEADYRLATTAGMHLVYFDSDPAASVSIAKDIYYRVIITPTSASNDIPIVMNVPTAAAMNVLDLGTDCVYTAATDRDSVDDWAQTTTKRVAIGLIADQLDDGASVGSGGAWGF